MNPIPQNPTTRQIFDYVVRHLLAQNAQSGDADGFCLYRDGLLRCAVGALIDDSHYDDSLEELAADEEPVKAAVELSIGRKLGPEDILLLKDLQRVHDSYDPEYWPARLDIIGARFFPEEEPRLAIEQGDSDCEF